MFTFVSMKKQNPLCFLVLSLIFLAVAVRVAADVPFYYYFRTLDTMSGLSHSTVNVMLQDCNGFMWMGTKDGLNRYDGLSFRVFHKEDSGLGNNFVTALHEDKDGDIWVGTDAGVYIYHPGREDFSSFDKIPSGMDGRIKRSVTCIASDGRGNVWIASDGEGLFCYDKKAGSLKTCIAYAEKALPNITHFWFGEDCVWMGCYEDNLYLFDEKSGIKGFKDNEGRESFKGKIINASVKGLHNCLYVAASDGLWEINLTTRKVRSLLKEYVRSVCLRTDTELWAGTEQGLYIYDLKKDTCVHLTTSVSDDRYALSDNAIYSVFKDKEGGMWIGSYFGGVNYYPYPYTYFEKYYPHDGLLYMGRRVREFCADNDGMVWIGTEDKGLFCFNPSDGSLKPFVHPDLYHNIHGLCLDGNSLWVGTFAGGLNRIDLRTRRLKHYRKGDAPNTLNADNVFSVFRSSTDEVWIGTTSGLLRYNRTTDDFTRIRQMENVFVYDIQEDSSGRLWMATYSDGVFCYDIPHGEWRKYSRQADDSTSLPYNKVISIFEDSRKRLWFMTQGAGFCRYVFETDSFVRYDMSDGFPSNIVYKMLEDDNGLLWLATNNGLVSFQPETEIKHLYTTANGLLDNQFNYQSGYKDEKGKLYLGSINGFVSFDPSTFIRNKQISPIVLTDFFLYNKRILIGGKDSPLQQSVTLSDAITLDADQNSFSLRAVVLSYQAPLSNRVLYKLDGFDKEWFLLDNADSRISYSNLPYGSYTLRVRGANSDGIWNPSEKTLQIKVRPPLYLSGAAYAFYFILSAGMALALVRYFRRRSLRRHQMAMEKLEYEKERELYAAKIDFFTNVAHEIRTPLTLIKSPLENVLSSGHVDDAVKDDLEIMDMNTNRLLDLVNQLLDFRKTETKGFQLNFADYNISDILGKTYIRFTPLAKDKGLEFTVETVDSLHAAVDKEGFTKIVSNLLTNAVKYAGSYIHVELKPDEDGKSFSLRITNDGKVIPPAMREEIFKPFIQYRESGSFKTPGTGIGLALARSLAELHGGTLKMDDASECNRFILTLPVYQEKALRLTRKEPEETAVETDEVRGGSPAGFRYTVLIVEDNAELRRFLQKQLSDSYRILCASNGVEALDVLRDAVINLIVSDVMMPEMDGLELCDKVKSDLDYSHIPVILLTARTTLQAKMDGLNAGADAYVEKPFSMDYLKVCISSLLKNREQLQAAFMHAPFVPTNSVAISKADEDFLKKLNGVVQANIQNPDFSMIDLAEQLCMSRSSLNRKIKGVLDVTPNDYIRIERLKKAAQLLQEGTCKINEVCYMVGFNTPSYFAKCFQKQFGVLPKDFAGNGK